MPLMTANEVRIVLSLFSPSQYVCASLRIVGTSCVIKLQSEEIGFNSAYKDPNTARIS